MCILFVSQENIAEETEINAEQKPVEKEAKPSSSVGSSLKADVLTLLKSPKVNDFKI